MIRSCGDKPRFAHSSVGRPLGSAFQSPDQCCCDRGCVSISPLLSVLLDVSPEVELLAPVEITYFVFWLHCMACGILVSQPGIGPGSQQWKVPSPNDWTTREFSGNVYFFEELVCFPQCLHHFTFPLTVHKGSNFSTSSPLGFCFLQK